MGEEKVASSIQQFRIKYKDMKIWIFALVLVGTASHALARREAQAGSSSSDISKSDCHCQCSSLTYVNRYGTTKGNCKTSHNGIRWCYVRGGSNSPCAHKRPSKTFPGNYWSYNACSTPSYKDWPCTKYNLPWWWKKEQSS